MAKFAINFFLKSRQDSASQFLTVREVLKTIELIRMVSIK